MVFKKYNLQMTNEALLYGLLYMPVMGFLAGLFIAGFLYFSHWD